MRRTLCALAVLVCGRSAVAEIIDVPGDFPTIQEAIDAATDGDEVVVAEGTYVETINLRGKAITVRSTDPDDPKVVLATIIDGDGAGSVVTCESGEGPDTVLSGFFITGGDRFEGGGGMRNTDASSPTVSECVFSGNAGFFGGGMYNEGGSSPAVTGCLFIANTSMFLAGGMTNFDDCEPMVENCTFRDNAGRFGGGMYNARNSPMVTFCVFDGNLATDGGGGIHNNGAALTVSDCEFTGNSAPGNVGGGAMYNISADVIATGCTFTNNAAGVEGGAVKNATNAAATFTDCTFHYNEALDGGGMFTDRQAGVLTVTDCTFRKHNGGKFGGAIFLFSVGARFGNSLFCDNQPHHIFATEEWIDEGGNEFLDECPCHADLNGDGDIDFDDLLILLAAWGDEYVPEDLDNDGPVDFGDLLVVLAAWGECE